MATLSFDVPAEVFVRQYASAEEFLRGLQFGGASWWYGRSEITHGCAAETADCRHEPCRS